MRHTIKPKPLRERVYASLLDQIVSGKISPGAPMRDTRISEQLGVSRTPVREALLRLTREGLLENHHHRGFQVSPLSPEVVAQTYPIINALETLALTQITSVDERTIQRLTDLNLELKERGTEPAARIRLDNEWHMTLLRLCGNDRLLELVREIKRALLRYEYAYMTDAELVHHSYLEHHEIVRALNPLNLDAASSVLNQHWEHTRQVLLDQLQTVHKS